MVKLGYTIMIAAMSDGKSGIEKLWKRGISNRCRDYPNVGKYMAKNYFKAFQSVAPYCFTNKKYWYIDKRYKS